MTYASKLVAFSMPIPGKTSSYLIRVMVVDQTSEREDPHQLRLSGDNGHLGEGHDRCGSWAPAVSIGQ